MSCPKIALHPNSVLSCPKIAYTPTVYMETKKQEDYSSREKKQSRYDKRLILKIVKEIEDGLPRKEANRIYGLGKSSLNSYIVVSGLKSIFV